MSKKVKNLLTLGVIADNLSDSEKAHAARLEAQRFYKHVTGKELPLECFAVEKDENDDFVVTIKEGNHE